MPVLAARFLSGFSGFASFLAVFVTKKVALAVAAVAAFSILTTGLYAAMAVAISGLIGSFPESGSAISTMLWVALPDAVPLMISACIGADTVIALYRWNVENVRLAATVS